MDEEYSQMSPEADLDEMDEMTAPAPERRRLGTGQIALIVGGAVAVLLAAVYVAVCAVAARDDSVRSGTSVMGVNVSGMTREQVETLWEKERERICRETEIPVLIDGEEIGRLSLADLAVEILPEEAAKSAYTAGRGNSFLTGGWAYLRSRFHTADVTPRFTVDEDAFEEILDQLGEMLGCTVIDGAYRIDEGEDGGLYVTKPRDGIQIDSRALRLSVENAVSNGDLHPIECSYEQVEAKPLDLDAVYQELHAQMRNAGYDKETGELTEAQVGVEFDVDEVKALLEEAEPGTEFLVPGTVEFPAVTKEELQDVLFRDCLGQYTTVVSGSSNRLNNVRRAAGMVNGIILNSGEQFSYNGVVGNPSKEAGYLPAPGYVRGKTVDVYGGGVCQVSSTLYYAALLSNLKIVTRYCHQYAPGYITWGCDATTFYPWPDFVFENDTDYPIKIVAVYSSNNRLTLALYGTKVDDTYVRITNKVLSTTPSHVEYVEDTSLAPGQKVTEQSGYTGYYVRTWRNVYAGDGTLLSSTVEANSDYEMRPTIIRIGPEKAAEAPAGETGGESTGGETGGGTTGGESAGGETGGSAGETGGTTGESGGTAGETGEPTAGGGTTGGGTGENPGENQEP